MELPFPPGTPPRQAGPLARFVPPLEDGAVARALAGFGAPGDRVLDPFGASPRLVAEAARAGRAVLVAANNPINRFLLEHTLEPFSLAELQAALARLAAAPIDSSRLEPFLLDLYRSECGHCGLDVIVDYFVWEKEAEGPELKGYACPHCNHTGEDAASQADWERAQAYTRRGMQQAIAMEQVAPRGDPDRPHAEAALAVYPGRALYALTTLTRKLGQLEFEPRLREAAEALLLSAFDAANALWGHPEGRPRPLQLSASPHYREANVWRALERGLAEWALESPEVRVEAWTPGKLPEPGDVALYAGPVRDLAAQIEKGAVRSLVTVLPRPNQAYWTLSALWTAWLWGAEAAGPIKVALRRRRYDWGWHAAALRTTLLSVAPCLEERTPVLAFIPEAEGGFLAAALAALDAAGFALRGRALRAGEEQALLAWEAAGPAAGPQPLEGLEARMARAVAESLRVRGEPAPYLAVHAAAWTDLARDRCLGPNWRPEEPNPLASLVDAFEHALERREVFVRWGAGAEPETGLYWLIDPAWAALPLADRVESLVLEALSRTSERPLVEIETYVCAALPGLHTPDRRLILACLRSYAVEQPEAGVWRLRPEDQSAARLADCREILELLRDLGQRLGYQPQGDEPIAWLDAQGQPAYAFRVRANAGLGGLLSAEGPPAILVLPGGRASLVAEMARRDPRLRAFLERGRVVKFRHVRRLAAETTLRPDNFDERLALDPPEHRDPQLPLL